MTLEFGFSGRSFYVPSAFYISTAHGVINDSDGSVLPGGWPSLMHEYGHLVQDRTSIFGAIEFMHFVDSLQSMSQMLQELGDQVRIPISASPSARSSLLASIYALRAATNPRRTWRNGVWWAYEEHQIKTVEVSYLGEFHIPVAVARFVDNTTDEIYEHEIGPREIKEAYSVAIEVLHGGSPVGDAKAFEYLAIERILGKAGPLDERQIAAICHWALQHPLPGVRFFEIVAALEKNGPMLPADSLYDWLRQRAMQDGIAKRVADVGSQLDKIVDVQRASGEDDLLFNVFRWYRDKVVVALARNLDTKRRFPIDTYLCSGSKDAGFDSVLGEEPIPVVETPSGAIYAFGGKSIDSHHVLFIRSLGELIERLWGESAPEWPCVVEKSCLLDCRDAGCGTRPFDKGARRPACPYGAAAAYFGIPALRALP